MECPLFSLRYFEDGTPATNPFADVIERCQRDHSGLLAIARARKGAARTWCIFGGLALLLARYIGGWALAITAVCVALAIPLWFKGERLKKTAGKFPR